MTRAALVRRYAWPVERFDDLKIAPFRGRVVARSHRARRRGHGDQAGRSPPRAPRARLLQPAIKCRGRDYLRIIHGIDYDVPAKPGAAARATRRSKLNVLDENCRALAAMEHVAIVPIRQMGGTVIDHLDVCGRKLSYTATIKHGRDVVAKLVEEFGHRALHAESVQGVDWKALSHAVRIAGQAIELLRTGGSRCRYRTRRTTKGRTPNLLPLPMRV